MSVEVARTGADPLLPARAPAAREQGGAADAFDRALEGANESQASEAAEAAGEEGASRPVKTPTAGAVKEDEKADEALAGAPVPATTQPAVEPWMLLAQGAFVSREGKAGDAPVATAEAAVDAVNGAGAGPKPAKGMPALPTTLGTAQDAAVDVPVAPVAPAAKPNGAATARSTAQRLANLAAADAAAAPQRTAPSQALPPKEELAAASLSAQARTIQAAVTETVATVATPRRAERSTERGSATGTLADPGSATVGTSSSASASSAWMAPVDAASAAASAGGAVLADRMTEQVSWWLAQKSQGADVSLELAPGQTVSFSVQVQGNEAQIAFRSDQPEVRQMLGQAAAQLKDLFGQEGLLLSGVTVDAQSAGTQQRGEGEGRPDARGLVRGVARLGAASASAPAPAVARAPLPAGRALDLYV
ncbi:flagellar hook-length control protein FliK [Variovorax sp.]|uniref:flagellar hook-length control protein FliK n=3 Tax=Variovorax sp. TaxID=1871043 RepID=UPI00120D43B4|nr:flagellar hook-length control protein FliK [Variovorax sp.]TAJ57728.1 MAG: flagellar hook-length control protein FliK [Variovorax sp.]